MQLEMKVISDIVTHYEELFGINEVGVNTSTIRNMSKKCCVGFDFIPSTCIC